MKKFSIPCNFGGAQSPFTVYIGNPEAKHHPLHFQAEWLAKERGGTVPQEIMDSLSKLKDLAEKNGVPFEELCTYALEAAGAPAVEGPKQQQVEGQTAAPDAPQSAEPASTQATSSAPEAPQQAAPQTAPAPAENKEAPPPAPEGK